MPSVSLPNLALMFLFEWLYLKIGCGLWPSALCPSWSPLLVFILCISLEILESFKNFLKTFFWGEETLFRIMLSILISLPRKSLKYVVFQSQTKLYSFFLKSLIGFILKHRSTYFTSFLSMCSWCLTFLNPRANFATVVSCIFSYKILFWISIWVCRTWRNSFTCINVGNHVGS